MVRKIIKSNVAHCPFCTREDDRTGDEIRIKECNAYCRLQEEMRRGYPLDIFCRKLDTYSDTDLLKADAVKAAKLYGINPDHAAGYIRLETEKRGIRNGAREQRNNSGARKTVAKRKRRALAA